MSLFRATTKMRKKAPTRLIKPEGEGRTAKSRSGETLKNPNRCPQKEDRTRSRKPKNHSVGYRRMTRPRLIP